MFISQTVRARELRTASEERCERDYGSVHANLCCPISWRPNRGRSYVREFSDNTTVKPTYFRATSQEVRMVGGYTEDLENYRTVQISSLQ